MNEKPKSKSPQLLKLKTFKFLSENDNKNALNDINRWIKKQYESEKNIQIINVSTMLRSYSESAPDYFYYVWYYEK